MLLDEVQKLPIVFIRKQYCDHIFEYLYLMDKDYKIKNFTPEPFSKSTKAKIFDSLGDKIVKVSKAIYSRSLSPNKIDSVDNLEFKTDPLIQLKHMRPISLAQKSKNSGRKFHYEGKQILTLPRLPYGKHSNYSETEFIKKHIIDMDLPHHNQAEFKAFNKLYKIQLKAERKKKESHRSTVHSKN